MLGQHHYDPTFKYSSKTLKQVLSKLDTSQRNICTDLPCGNGRNIFLLSKYFKTVIGIDYNEHYIDEIKAKNAIYNSNNLSFQLLDLKKRIPDCIDNSDLITVVHFYDYEVLNSIKKRMKKGGRLYIETQSCHGENYLDLPNEDELERLFSGLTVITSKMKFCKSGNRVKKSISFYAMLEK